MGLFWSMIPRPGQKKGLRLMKRDVTTPLSVTIHVIEGHRDMSLIDSMDFDRVTLKQTCYRWYMAKDVQRTVLDERHLRGALFIPAGNGSHCVTFLRL